MVALFPFFWSKTSSIILDEDVYKPFGVTRVHFDPLKQKRLKIAKPFSSFFIFLGLVSRHALEAEVSREGASFCHLWSQIVAQILHSVQPEGFDNGVSGVLNRKTSIYQTFQNIKPRTI